MNVSLSDGIDWVGYTDWTIRDFHGYSTKRGSSYNAYLVRDEKTALIDTVKAPYAKDLLKRTAALVNLDAIDYIVCNHAEPDHSGALPEVVKTCPNAEVVCNAKCRNALSAHYCTKNWRFRVIEDGASISIGRRTLTFINTPMVHWPESMFTYIPEEKILFSMDAFGQHYAAANRFDDEEPVEVVMMEAKTYFANIVMLYGAPIKKTLEKAAKIDIKIIAPSHGVIWRTHIASILAAYTDWVEHKSSNKVLIAYDTMWKSTEMMAKAIMDGVLESSAQARLINLRDGDITTLATEVLDSAAIAVGSPTLNKTLMPQVAAALTYLKGLSPHGKKGFAFGSYGWSSGGSNDVEDYLRAMKFDILRAPLTCRYLPDEKTLEECRDAGRMLVKNII